MPCIIIAKPNETTIDVSYSKIRPKSDATLEMFFPELKKNCILSVFAVFVAKVVLTISMKRIKRQRKSLRPIMRLINLILLSKPASYVISNHVAKKKKKKKREIKVINEKKKIFEDAKHTSRLRVIITHNVCSIIYLFFVLRIR